MGGELPPDAPVTVPCARFDLLEDIYHADGLCPEKSLSSTMAKRLLEPAGPARLKEILDNGQPRKKAWDYGTAAHEKILDRGPRVVAIDGNRNSNAVKELIAEAEARGELVLKSPEVAAIGRMAEALLANPLAAELLTAGQGRPEVSMFGIDPETGRWLRGRLDFLHSRRLIVDYKTTAKTSLDGFSRQAYDLGYYLQAAHYHQLAIALDLVDEDSEYLLIAQEKTAPYLVGVHRLDGDLAEQGAREIRRAIDLWDRCMTLDDWPGYPAEVHTEGEDE
jgi:hypothetical protein